MMEKVLLYFSIHLMIQRTYGSGSFPNYYKKIETIPLQNEHNLEEPLLLTPYIRSGRLKEAKEAAKVNHKDFLNVTHYSGFLTVNETYNSNLFIWFCPSEQHKTDPVVLWLQGGPGSTSLFGLFSENGPFKMKNDEVTLREQRWTKTNHMLYIDNPAGTGYSFTNPGGYARDQDKIARELFEAIQQFFELFPELRRNDFFIAGESYAGHYIPSVSYEILLKNRLIPNNKQVNLKGIAIGNGWTDPMNQLNYGEYLYQHGLVDLDTKLNINQHMKKAKSSITQNRFEDAKNEMDEILDIFKNVTGYANVYNYLYPFAEDDEPVMDKFVQRNDIRTAIHVGNAIFNDGSKVYEELTGDIMKSVVHLLPELINNFRVLLYDGQADIIVSYSSMVNYLEKLNFSHAQQYRYGKRNVWTVKNDIAGYAKVAGNLTDLLVRNAGHMVPSDQPDWAYDLIFRFTRNLNFSDIQD